MIRPGFNSAASDAVAERELVNGASYKRQQLSELMLLCHFTIAVRCLEVRRFPTIVVMARLVGARYTHRSRHCWL